LIEETLGWSSQGWPEKKAAGVLAELQENQRRGERPFTLREKREMEKSERQAQEVQEGQGLVFPSKTGEPMGQISATFMRTVDDLGWNKGVTDYRQRIVFHSLRHSYCSWLAMAGVPLYTLAQLSGHETMSMVQRYSHLSPGTLRDAVSLLNGNLKTKGKENLQKEKQHIRVPVDGTCLTLRGAK